MYIPSGYAVSSWILYCMTTLMPLLIICCGCLFEEIRDSIADLFGNVCCATCATITIMIVDYFIFAIPFFIAYHTVYGLRILLFILSIIGIVILIALCCGGPYIYTMAYGAVMDDDTRRTVAGICLFWAVLGNVIVIALNSFIANLWYGALYLTVLGFTFCPLIWGCCGGTA